jgi:hypothetical protein
VPIRNSRQQASLQCNSDSYLIARSVTICVCNGSRNRLLLSPVIIYDRKMCGKT